MVEGVGHPQRYKIINTVFSFQVEQICVYPSTTRGRVSNCYSRASADHVFGWCVQKISTVESIGC